MKQTPMNRKTPMTRKTPLKKTSDIGAGIPNDTRRAVYKRDDYQCALCGDPRRLQIHHAVHRSAGGSDFPENLITLCWRCHAAAHVGREQGKRFRALCDEYDITIYRAVKDFVDGAINSNSLYYEFRDERDAAQ